MEIGRLDIVATAEPVAEMDRLGDEIAELAAHLNAATAHWLDLIREFDARGGWANGFRSCAQWLSWRVGMVPAPRASTCAWPVPSARCRFSAARSPAESCPTPRYGS